LALDVHYWSKSNYPEGQAGYKRVAYELDKEIAMLLHRHTYYGLIHHGIKTLLLDRLGHYTEEEYHHYLSLMTGKSTCFTMSLEELEATVDNLLREGYLEDVKTLISQYQRVA